MKLPFFLVLLYLLICSVSGRFDDVLDKNSLLFFQNDFYGALGVTSEATAKEIKKAYRNLSKKYHPDRNRGNKKAQARFVDIARAQEYLLDEQLREDYDRFINELPYGFRPVYGVERPAFRRISHDPITVSVCGFLFFVSMISVMQNSQYKRERTKAFQSEFYAKSLETAISKGKTKEEFDRIFLIVNPELKREWKDTLLMKLLYLPARCCCGRGAEDAAPELLDDAAEEKSGDEGHVDEAKLEADRRAAEKQAKIREKQQRARKYDDQRKAELKKDRVRKTKMKKRSKQIETKLSMELAHDIISKSPALMAYLEQLDFIERHPSKDFNFADDIGIGNIQDILMELLEKEDDNDFWELVFDKCFVDFFERKRLEEEEEREKEEEEQRKRLAALHDDNDNDTDDQDGDAETDSVEGEQGGEVEDDEWGKELAAKEAAKKAKKEQAKLAKQKKAEENKLKNEVAKKGKQNGSKGKKERRRR